MRLLLLLRPGPGPKQCEKRYRERHAVLPQLDLRRHPASKAEVLRTVILRCRSRPANANEAAGGFIRPISEGQGLDLRHRYGLIDQRVTRVSGRPASFRAA